MSAMPISTASRLQGSQLTCVVYVWHLVLIPQNGLCWVQRQLVDNLCLEAPPLISADHNFHQELNTVGPGIILSHQPGSSVLSSELASQKATALADNACQDSMQSPPLMQRIGYVWAAEYLLGFWIVVCMRAKTACNLAAATTLSTLPNTLPAAPLYKLVRSSIAQC